MTDDLRQQQDASHVAAPVSQAQTAAATEKEAPPGRDDSRERDWFAIFSLVFDLIVAVCAVLGGYFIYDQLRLMRQSNELTREALDFAKEGAKGSAAETANAVALAERSARAAERAADAALAGLDATKRQLILGETGLAITDRSVRNRERPWLVVSSIEGAPTKDAEARITVKFRNAGILPALQASVAARFFTGDTFPDTPPLVVKTRTSVSVVGPGQGIESWLTVKLEGAEADAVTGGRKRLYVYGKAMYADPSGVNHETSFCQQFSPNPADWIYCDRYNRLE